MATADKGPNKTSFLRDLFRKDPGVNEQQARDAWAKAGNDDTISSSLFYTTKAALNKETVDAPEAGPSPKKAAPKKAASKPRAAAADSTPAPPRERKPKDDDRERMLTDIEGDLDRIIFKLMVLGGMERI